MDLYDVIVLGAGPPGENLAERVRAAGLSVAVVESELAGGECSYWACMPSKALLRPPTALAEARRLAGAREALTGDLDAAAVLGRRDAFAAHWDDSGQVDWIRSTGAEFVRGHGRIDGPCRVIVETPAGVQRLLTARHAVAVCTGSTAALPDLPGLPEALPWTNREGTGAREVPGRLAVVGGGPVAVELAYAWQALGADVTMLVRGGRLLERMEPFAGEHVAEGLREAGVDVRFGVSVGGVRRPDPEGEITLELDDGGQLVANQALFATGRRPRTDDIGLETVGLEPGAWLPVDDTLRVTGVSGDWLYAVGDVNHRALLTHQGKYQARIAGAAIAARAHGGTELDTARWGAHQATADRDAVTQVVFGVPEAAAVGLTVAEAEERGLRVRAVDFDLGRVSGAVLFADDYRGHARMVVDRERGVLVGATFVGPGVSELLHSASVAVVGEVPVERLWHAVPAYPTISEIWLRLLETWRDGEDGGGESGGAG
ncbi:NAD(P)/FAD-dependent oxidoreductase [Streptomyces durbertensis]|uniref:NAD(P)/FAD-dependent oxidoreductase n=1 Tax=Streptomyces durbertensis TaxID=2448886 RepID=A0ABR6EAG0_9ACTN|nr:NAD(P)/FAD-dependent oxidoreductase [Streptomyces durbertensis]MBB1242334.1 NAD(P)/FAD-dependent oxidoreductase [Streptomyces durbertensis]